MPGIYVDTRAEKIIEQLRAELEAAKAANSDNRMALFEAAAKREAFRDEVLRLEAERDEARGAARLATDAILRHAPHMKPVYLTNMIARWDAERPAPVTNRDTGDESGAA